MTPPAAFGSVNVVITGANRGIGLALARLYVARGDRVVAGCRAPATAFELNEFTRSKSVRVLPLDVNDAGSVYSFAECLAKEEIHVLINNAGIIGHPGDRQTATSMDFSLWNDILNSNTLGPVRVMQALLPALKRTAHSKVINITSDLGALSNDNPIFLGYSASKAALNKFMRLAAIELKEHGVAVGLIHPGWVQTDMGGKNAPLTPIESATGIAKVIDRLSIENTGSFWQWDGELHAW